VRYVWLAIIAVSLAPTLVAGFFANPLAFLLLGPDVWRDRVARLLPYRWWILLSLLVCALATTVYGIAYR
jgi:hypothetical protein